MDALNRQVAAMTDEMQLLKAELIQIKTAHAGLHQNTVDRAAEAARKFEEVGQKIEAITDGDGRGFSGPKPKKLIEPKEVKVATFMGAITDSRGKFQSGRRW